MAVIVLVVVAWCGARGALAVRSALGAKRALVAAEADLGAARAGPARAHLIQARDDFARSRSHLRAMGPVLTVARFVPLVRVQVRGMEAFTAAGRDLAAAGIPISDAAAGVAAPADDKVRVEDALSSLQKVHDSLQAGVASLDAANARVRSLDGYRLLGPLSGARKDLLTRLPRIRARAGSAERGLAAVISFVGGDGPRRYLVFSQNPDEVRPTGGFIGTYGVLSASEGKLKLERYEGIEGWLGAHPDVVLSPEEAGSPFNLSDPPMRQSLANVNDTPDWATSAQLAATLWQRGGEQPVDGALSVSPAFLARALAVLGPVPVEGYDETVTAADVNARIEFHTHREPPPPGTNRKDFVAAVAQAVVQKLLAAPASKWYPLAKAMGASFEAREAMVWAKDPMVQTEVAARRWDSVLPDVFGDFFFGGEFEYAAKNGRGLKRTYLHQVELHKDGSARITTTVTIANTKPPEPNFNEHSLSYITLYGPRDATLDETASDVDAIGETPVGAHPAAGWFRSADPMDQTTVKIVWNAPHVARLLPGGSLQYGLWFMGLADHSGDVVNLEVMPPPEWRWEGKAPPNSVALDRDLVDTWLLVRGG